MTHSLILDIETLALVPSAVVFEIAALAVRRDDFTVEDRLLLRLDPDIQILSGRKVDAETIKFHLDRGTYPDAGGLSSKAAVESLCAFFERWRPWNVWIQGPDFDRPILENLFAEHGRTLPWKYSYTRDSRTAWSLAFPGVKRSTPPPHKALEDCEQTLANLKAALIELGRPLSI